MSLSADGQCAALRDKANYIRLSAAPIPSLHPNHLLYNGRLLALGCRALGSFALLTRDSEPPHVPIHTHFTSSGKTYPAVKRPAYLWYTLSIKVICSRIRVSSF